MIEILAQAGHETESFKDLLLDPNHWYIEGVAEVAFFIIEVAIIARLVRWHDQRKHKGHTHGNDEGEHHDHHEG